MIFHIFIYMKYYHLEGNFVVPVPQNKGNVGSRNEIEVIEVD